MEKVPPTTPSPSHQEESGIEPWPAALEAVVLSLGLRGGMIYEAQMHSKTKHKPTHQQECWTYSSFTQGTDHGLSRREEWISDASKRNNVLQTFTGIQHYQQRHKANTSVLKGNQISLLCVKNTTAKFSVH